MNSFIASVILLIGDAHIYNDHVDAIKDQIQRVPMEFPKLKILKQPQLSMNADEILKEIESVEFQDLKLEGYRSHGRLAMNMSV